MHNRIYAKFISELFSNVKIPTKTSLSNTARNKIRETKTFTYHPLFLRFRIRTKEKGENVFPPSVAVLLVSYIYKPVTGLISLFLMTKKAGVDSDF